MGCDDAPESLFSKIRPNPTAADFDRLEARVEELERLIGLLRESYMSPLGVRMALAIEHSHQVSANTEGGKQA